MTDKNVNATIEILGKLYPIRCPESEVKSLQQAAEYLNQKMTEVQNSGKAINLERIAIITALNIAHQFLQVDQQKEGRMLSINQRLARLNEQLEHAMKKTFQTDLIYTSE